MRAPTLSEKLLQRLVVLPAVLVALVGVLVLLYSAVNWLLPVGRLVAALPDALLGLFMMVGGFSMGAVFAKLSRPPRGMPNPRFDPSRWKHEHVKDSPR